MIYVIQQGDNGPVKIGYAKDPKKRLKTLQCGNPVVLYLRRSGEGELSDEVRIHRCLRALGLGIRAEWFKPEALDRIVLRRTMRNNPRASHYRPAVVLSTGELEKMPPLP